MSSVLYVTLPQATAPLSRFRVTGTFSVVQSAARFDFVVVVVLTVPMDLFENLQTMLNSDP